MELGNELGKYAAHCSSCCAVRGHKKSNTARKRLPIKSHVDDELWVGTYHILSRRVNNNNNNRCTYHHIISRASQTLYVHRGDKTP